MARFKDSAICIREMDWSETSQLVTLLTREQGKVRGLAKGSKRTSPSSVARYCGGFELLTKGQAVGAMRATGLTTLTEWDLQETYRHLREDLGAQQIAMYAADVADAMLAEHDPHAGAYEALSDLLAGLAERGDQQGGLLGYQWRLLVECGFRPEVWKDAATGGELGERAAYWFDPRGGGVTGGVEGANGKYGNDERGAGPWGVRRDTVELLRKVAAGVDGGGGDIAGVIRGCEDEVVRRANRLLCAYFRAILDRELPTMGLVYSGQ